MPEASPWSVVICAREPGPPANIQVNQSCGNSTAEVRAALSGSCWAIQRSLVTVNDAAGTEPIVSAQLLRAAQLRHHIGNLRCGPQVVPQQCRSHNSSGAVQGDHAVLLPTDRNRRCALQQPGTRLLQGFPPRRRVDLGAGRVRCGRLVDDAPSAALTNSTLVDWVEESIPATRTSFMMPPVISPVWGLRSAARYRRTRLPVKQPRSRVRRTPPGTSPRGPPAPWL